MTELMLVKCSMDFFLFTGKLNECQKEVKSPLPCFISSITSRGSSLVPASRDFKPILNGTEKKSSWKGKRKTFKRTYKVQTDENIGIKFNYIIANHAITVYQ